MDIRTWEEKLTPEERRGLYCERAHTERVKYETEQAEMRLREKELENNRRFFTMDDNELRYGKHKLWSTLALRLASMFTLAYIISQILG